jgi:hypothetical protein
LADWRAKASCGGCNIPAQTALALKLSQWSHPGLLSGKLKKQWPWTYRSHFGRQLSQQFSKKYCRPHWYLLDLWCGQFENSGNCENDIRCCGFHTPDTVVEFVHCFLSEMMHWSGRCSRKCMTHLAVSGT